VENIESRFDSYLEQENRVNRQKIVDNRVHACLYFIQPTGHSSVVLLFWIVLCNLIRPNRAQPETTRY
jgi:hypothetical protein